MLLEKERRGREKEAKSEKKQREQRRAYAKRHDGAI